jgi:hypothetical protein
VRTTLTLDPDVAKMLEQEVHRVRRPLKQVVNEALRRSLTTSHSGARSKPYRVSPHAARFLPGIDAGRLGALADEIEDAAILARTGVSKRS